MRMLDVLEKIAKEFNKNNVKWAVGASLLLYFYNIVEKPNDIDLIIDSKDEDIVCEIMNKLGNEQSVESVRKYKTGVFHKFYIKEIEVDIIGDFNILVNDKYYLHPFPNSTGKSILINETKIYLDSLSNWLDTYIAMGDPKNRVKLIKKFLNNR
ncbi:MAG: hypothetical protein U9N10_01175 [Bacillota bacterium]|nr:hypothetical protein [Bacillota bacterium]